MKLSFLAFHEIFDEFGHTCCYKQMNVTLLMSYISFVDPQTFHLMLPLIQYSNFSNILVGDQIPVRLMIIPATADERC